MDAKEARELYARQKAQHEKDLKARAEREALMKFNAAASRKAADDARAAMRRS